MCARGTNERSISKELSGKKRAREREKIKVERGRMLSVSHSLTIHESIMFYVNVLIIELICHTYIEAVLHLISMIIFICILTTIIIIIIEEEDMLETNNKSFSIEYLIARKSPPPPPPTASSRFFFLHSQLFQNHHDETLEKKMKNALL